jgi:hypothetical protein
MSEVIEIKECPVCKSKRGVCRELFEKEKAAGKVSRQDLAVGIPLSVTICDNDMAMQGRILTAPMLMATLEICADCGAAYASWRRTETVPLTTPQMPKMPKLA